ncbi:HIT family protein [Ornithinimicrobium panacihumi]|uniref:HIT family protein n=1 Tax=Ornithinimicrobium panacihumi TaxID=2008449 RepID=UPI003F8BCED4
MATIFTKIIEGEIPGQLVHADDVCAAFMDIEPLTPGHVLLVPRAEIDHWIDLDDDTTAHLMSVARRIGQAQMEVFGRERIGLVIQGFEVPHAHIHLFPADDMGDFDADRRGPRSPEALATDADAIRAALGRA